MQRSIAQQRLKRDFIELQREKLLSINAHPLDNNIFEWHANIQPTNGVYSGVYLHLILTFPSTYPSSPPKVQMCTPIQHPNVFDSFICLSMLREHTSTVPYEGWSSAYSITSILMQLQSFLFADKIDQDYGSRESARRSLSDIQRSISICKNFKCKCGHTHETPSPVVEGPAQTLVNICPMDKHNNNIEIQGAYCQHLQNKWIGVYGQYGCSYGKIMYEAFVDWIPNRGYSGTVPVIPDIAFGFGTQSSWICGADKESFGYMGYGNFIYNDKRQKYGTKYSKHDTITCAIDFTKRVIYFGKNGILFNQHILLPGYLQKKQLLFPVMSCKKARVEFNFGTPKKPCQWLIDNKFQTFEQIAIKHGVIMKQTTEQKQSNCIEKFWMSSKCDWHSQYVIPEIWIKIFSHLTVQDIHNVQFVCKKWSKCVNKYNITERSEMLCYFSKDKLGDKILGIGLDIEESNVGYRVLLNSQLDILGLNAWQNGCRVGVWGETLTHFLPLVMNRQHSELAQEFIIKHLQDILNAWKSIEMKSFHGKQREQNPNKLELEIKNLECLQLVDILITMMNQMVVQFVTGNDIQNINPTQVSMVVCDKVVVGYCYLHHLLLYLKSRNKSKVVKFANKTVETFIHDKNGPSKSITRDLGKFLIYLMLSDFSWCDVAALFIEESFTRRVRWFVGKSDMYKKYDTTEFIEGRVKDSFVASKTSRRLIMFQVWFMKNNMSETLSGYNERLGRPTMNVRNGIVPKAKQILRSTSYDDYFKELDISSLNCNQEIDQLLRFAVYNSFCRKYHWRKDNYYTKMEPVYPPIISVKNGKPEMCSRCGGFALKHTSLTKLRVKGLPSNITEKQLRILFNCYGQIKNCNVIASHGLGFVEYESVCGSNNALSEMNEYKMNGICLNVSPENPQRKNKVFNNHRLLNKNLYIQNIPLYFQRNDLHALFCKFGVIEYYNILKNKINGQSKGVGFVQFRTVNEANNAMMEMNGKQIDYAQNVLPLVVKYAQNNYKSKSLEYGGFNNNALNMSSVSIISPPQNSYNYNLYMLPMQYCSNTYPNMSNQINYNMNTMTYINNISNNGYHSLDWKQF